MASSTLARKTKTPKRAKAQGNALTRTNGPTHRMAARKAELEQIAKDEHRLAVEAAGRALQHARKAGQALIDLAPHIGHGNRESYYRTLGMSERTAQAYMRIARNWPQIEAAGATTVTAAIIAASNAKPEAAPKTATSTGDAQHTTGDQPQPAAAQQDAGSTTSTAGDQPPKPSTSTTPPNVGTLTPADVADTCAGILAEVRSLVALHPESLLGPAGGQFLNDLEDLCRQAREYRAAHSARRTVERPATVLTQADPAPTFAPTPADMTELIGGNADKQGQGPTLRLDPDNYTPGNPTLTLDRRS